jgi:hypothetical protein
VDWAQRELAPLGAKCSTCGWAPARAYGLATTSTEDSIPEDDSSTKECGNTSDEMCVRKRCIVEHVVGVCRCHTGQACPGGHTCKAGQVNQVAAPRSVASSKPNTKEQDLSVPASL